MLGSLSSRLLKSLPTFCSPRTQINPLSESMQWIATLRVLPYGPRSRQERMTHR
jgi:hypothetical protein